jgi:hypothetical protein
MRLSMKPSFNNETYWVGILLLMSTIFYVIMALTTLTDYGGADSYWHYFITHYAFQRPGLFLDHWGKPLFTALSSPFAYYFGFLGLQLFNVMISISSAYIAWRLCRKLNFQFSWVSIILTLFAPIYFILVASGLTEILFSLVLIMAVYMFFTDKYVFSAIIISFIPFARNEGIIFIPLFALALVYHKKWLPLLFLATGFVFYGIIGYFYYHDFFWLITKSPYHGAKDIYGSGSLWHFVKSYREIFGKGLTWLMILGIIGYVLPFFRKWKRSSLPVTEILLIIMPVALYFAAHSYLWWKGLGGSAGLTRVIAGIIPLASVLGVRGLNLLAPLINRTKATRFVIILLICCYIVYDPFDLYKIPFPPGNEEKVFNKVYNWIEKEKPIENKLWVLHPYLVFKLDMDPYDGKTVGLNFPMIDELTKDTHPGDLMIWDSHFGPNEGHVPLDSFMNNKYFEIKAYFPSDESFYNQDNPYEIYVFRRTADTTHINNHILLETLKMENYVTTPFYSNTFDTTGIYPDSSKTNACFRINKDLEFSPAMEKVMEETDLKTDDNIEISVDIWPLETKENSFINFVASIAYKSDVYMYQCYPIRFSTLKKNMWNKKEFKFVLPSISNKRAYFKVYLWNNEKNSMLMDN